MERAGFILVGGNSSRMGRDKALLPYGGATLVEHVAARVKAAAGWAALVGPPEKYGTLGYPVIRDLRPHCGPAAGIEAALLASKAEWNLVVACDMPAVTVDFLAALLDAAGRVAGDCLVPLPPSGRPEPLCAVYHRRSLPRITRALDGNVRKMARVLECMEAVFHPVAEALWFENLNTPEDWAMHRPAPPAGARRQNDE